MPAVVTAPIQVRLAELFQWTFWNFAREFSSFRRQGTLWESDVDLIPDTVHRWTPKTGH
jgi:hypothetical protein